MGIGSNIFISYNIFVIKDAMFEFWQIPKIFHYLYVCTYIAHT